MTEFVEVLIQPKPPLYKRVRLLSEQVIHTHKDEYDLVEQYLEGCLPYVGRCLEGWTGPETRRVLMRLRDNQERIH